MQEMSMQEVDAVSGALSADAGGVALTMVGLVAAGAGMAIAAPIAVGIGVGLLIGNAIWPL